MPGALFSFFRAHLRLNEISGWDSSLCYMGDSGLSWRTIRSMTLNLAVLALGAALVPGYDTFRK